MVHGYHQGSCGESTKPVRTRELSPDSGYNQNVKGNLSQTMKTTTRALRVGMLYCSLATTLSTEGGDAI